MITELKSVALDHSAMIAFGTVLCLVQDNSLVWGLNPRPSD